MKKRITSINIDKINSGDVNSPVYFSRNINPLGDSRDIDIYGNPGAVFSLEITNSAGYSILKNPLKLVTIPIRGVYSFRQVYPRITYNDIYTITITPLHNTELSNGVVNTYLQYQYLNTTSTFTYTTTDPYGGSGSYSGSNVAITSSAQSGTSPMTSAGYTFGRSTHTVTATHSSALLYTIPPNFSRDYSSSKDVTKTVKTTTLNSKTLQIHPNTSNLEVGMIFRVSNSFEKTVNKIIPDTSVVRDVEISPVFAVTDKFSINNTNSLIVGMVVSGGGAITGTTIVSIDSEQDITLSKKQNIQVGATLTFKQNVIGSIVSIDDLYQITLSNSISVPGGSTLTFNNNEEEFTVDTNVSGSGTSTITITNNVEVVRFGKEDSTYTQDIDNFIKLTPNAYSQRLEIKKNVGQGATIINVLTPDTDANVTAKTPSGGEDENAPKHGSLDLEFALGNGQCQYTPFPGFVGEDIFYFIVTDANGAASGRTPIYITVI